MGKLSYAKQRAREQTEAKRKADEKNKALNETRASIAKLLATAQRQKWLYDEQHEISSSLFNIDSVISGYCNRRRTR